MIFRGELTYEGRKAIEAFDQANWDALSKQVPQFKMGEWKEDGSHARHWWPGDDLLATDDDIRFLSELGIGFTVKHFKGMYKGSGSGVAIQSHDDMMKVVQIHISNIGLLQMDEVTYEEDCCTDKLQAMLDSGWRMIAVCPPNNARRPTYILGRSKVR